MSKLWTRSLAMAALAAAAALLWTHVPAAAGKDLDVIATLANNGPVALAASPVTVALAPPAGAAAIGERLAAAKPGRTLHLVLTGLRANTPPETLYQVH